MHPPTPTPCSIALRRRHILGLSLVLPCGQLGATETHGASPLRIETIQLEPFGYQRNNEKGGLMYDIGNLIAQRAGLAFENRIAPYPRTVVSLEVGTADLVLRFPNEELAHVAHQVAPILELPTVVLTLQSTPYRTLNLLAGARVGMPRSFGPDETLRQVPNLKFELLANYDATLQMLFARRIDAAYGSHLGLLGTGHRLNLPLDLLGAAIPTGQQTIWAHVSRKTATPERLERLKQACDALTQDGSIEKLYRQYLARYSASS